MPIIACPVEQVRYERVLREYIESMPSIRADRVCGKRPQFPKDYASAWAIRRHAVASVLHQGTRAGRDKDAGTDAATAWCGHGYRLVWKSIESLGRLGLVLDCLPDARSVHIVRHPCGYVASVLRGEAAARFAYNAAEADLPIYEMLSRTEPARRRGLTMQRFQDMGGIERLAWRWVIFNEVAFDGTAANPRNRIVLYYEALCAAPEDTTRELFAFTDLDWNEQTAAFLKSSTSRSRADYYSVFKDPLESAWRWTRRARRDRRCRVAEVAAGSVIAAPYFVANGWNRPATGFRDRG